MDGRVMAEIKDVHLKLVHKLLGQSSNPVTDSSEYFDTIAILPLCKDCGGTLWQGASRWVYCERCG